MTVKSQAEGEDTLLPCFIFILERMQETENEGKGNKTWFITRKEKDKIEIKLIIKINVKDKIKTPLKFKA